MARYYSTGKCNLCGGTFSRVGMARHLQACLARQPVPEKPEPRQRMRQERIFHISVAGRADPDYWMNLEVPAAAELADLDAFLRSIWLECCWHLSAFTVGGREYNSSPMDGFFGRRDRGMDVRLGKVLAPGVKFYHEYDFGSTTELTLRVVSERTDFVDGESIRVLARNDPPEYLCHSCGGTATTICVQCIYQGKGWLCDECARQHACGEDKFLPVVNSPRCGICGYSG